MGYQLYLSLLSKTPLGKYLQLSEEAETSFFMGAYPIQDAIRFRARYLGLKAADFILDEKGELQRENLALLLEELSKGTFSLGSNREVDPVIFQHIFSCLSRLQRDPALWNWIRRFSPPLFHKKAEDVIRESLHPEAIRSVQTVHVRRAAIASWLTWLRQTTGSCFATAPAILIQREQPVQFFKDLYDLLTIGQLKRVIEGKEYSVPFSPSLENGDLDRRLEEAENLAYSPGLRAALKAAEVDLSLLNQLEEKKTIRQILRDLLLKAYDLSEEDLEESLSPVQISPLIGQGYFYQRPSEKAQRIAEWKSSLERATSAFRATADCALLRTWEYTLASFSDVKIDFGRWNLTIGLGLHPSQKGGIADFLYHWLDERLQKYQQEFASLQRDYEQAFGNARALEVLLQNASSQSQQYRLKGELTSAVHAVNSALEMRDRAHQKAEAIAKFFPALLEQYDQKLQEYFQEVFDPSVSSQEGDVYEDSPAGFRLLYKHGRTRASTWSLIQNEKQYLDAFREFLSAIEPDIELPPALDRQFFSELTTALLTFVQQPEFIANAKERSQKAGRKSPWDYISGGTMQTLLQNYYTLRKLPTEIQWLPRSQEELLHFLSQVKGKRPLLMHSPTHAFLFRPDLLPDRCEEKVEECRLFIKKWHLDESAQEHLAHLLSERLFPSEKPLFLHLFRQQPVVETIPQLRQAMCEVLRQVRPALAETLVDSLLFEQCPIIGREKAAAVLETIFKKFSDRPSTISLEKDLFGALELQQQIQAILLQTLKAPFSSIDWDLAIRQAASSLGCCYPHPLLFADTNWSGWFFGWIVHPSTLQLQLWRLNRIGSRGFPMTGWEKWTSPENTTPWILLSNPEEYSPFP